MDIRPDTFNLDPSKLNDTISDLQQSINKGTTPQLRSVQKALSARRDRAGSIRAIIPVHFGGQPCDVDSIYATASQHGLAYIEDAAHALPSRYHGKLIGSPMALDHLLDNGFQLLASAMVFPKKLQVYTTYSESFGQYGVPSEVRLGFNFFPFKKTISTRLNGQVIFMNKCPVGGLAYPYAVGANGTIFNLDLELNF